ncbi:hypothetical protein [Sporosarcina sp. FSL K6-5500]|uniref:hypothetical protein n=1 Tax=Sporosarcina sp. FSL K6-5500 TaxID=2921558 RepID=UPI0030FA7973
MSLEIGVIGAIIGMLIGYFTFQRNRDKEIRSNASEDAVVRTKLDHISVGVHSIQLDLDKSSMRMSEVSDRVIRVEESAKQAHKRIDKIDGGRSD